MHDRKSGQGNMPSAEAIVVRGAARVKKLVGPNAQDTLMPLFTRLLQDRPGYRLPISALSESALDAVHGKVRCMIGDEARPVRALLFDKNDGANWSLAWHQDRTIAVRARHDVSGFGPWTRKAGQWHVAPPLSVLERMATVRIHLDDVDEGNAPLLIAPGSHRLGLVGEQHIDGVVQRCGVEACLADVGDVWFYSTLILHASERARPGRRRRVLQMDYAAFDLPGGLEWTA
jgi:hypothetical protein